MLRRFLSIGLVTSLLFGLPSSASAYNADLSPFTNGDFSDFSTLPITLTDDSDNIAITSGDESESNDSEYETSPTVKIIAYNYTWSGLIFPSHIGSGTVITEDGLIISNSHVVTDSYNDNEPMDAFAICFTTDPQEKPRCTHTARYIADDADMDVALIAIDGDEGETFPYLDYQISDAPELEADVTIYGYPITGGNTITSTQGSVSGFETVNGYQYVKTDAYISFGNSGGTVINEDGEFIGIPTYLVWDLGYFLDIREAQDWIDENMENEPTTDESITNQLQQYLDEFQSTYTDSTMTHPDTPRFSVSLPNEDWYFWNIFNYGTQVAHVDRDSTVDFLSQTYPFEITDEWIEKQIDALEVAFGIDEEDEFEVEETSVNGYEAHHIWFEFFSYYEIHTYLIPYGPHLVTVSAYLVIDDRDEEMEDLNELLDTFEFLDEPETPSHATTYESSHEDLAFSIEADEDWEFQPNQSPVYSELLVNALLEDDPMAAFSVSVDEVKSYHKDDAYSDILDSYLNSREWLTEFNLIAKDADVSLKGLPGFSFSYTFEMYEETYKSFELYVRYSEDLWLYFDYTDRESDYQTRLDSVLDTIASLEHESPDYESSTEVRLGTFESVFGDIDNHRYEESIMDLYDRGLVEGFDGGYFYPEQNSTRAEAVKIIVMAKVLADYQEELEAAETFLEEFLEERYALLDFGDTRGTWVSKYVRYGRHIGALRGYSTGEFLGSFYPEDDLTLAAALSILFNVHEVSYWEDTSGRMVVDWQKPLMDRAYELEILPTDLNDPSRVLTRGEFSGIVSNFLAESSWNFFF